MSWQEELNKKLEKQRAGYQESVDNGDALGRIRSAGAVHGGKVSGGREFTKIWEEDPEFFKASCIQGGITQGNINKEQGLGIFSQTKEERQENARKANKSFWDNATPEEIEAKYKKSGKSISNAIQEKKANGTYIPPQSYKTQEQIDAAAKKMKATVLQKKIDAIQVLYDTIDNDGWFDLNQGLEYIQSYRTGSLSTARRMLYSWTESKIFFKSSADNKRFKKLKRAI